MDASALKQAIDIRCSRRKYLGTPIGPALAARLKALAAEYSKAEGIRLELITNNGKAFNGFTKSYGMFSGVNDYFCLIAAKDNTTAVERLGYYGELLVLRATSLGLGTCWVGGMFSRSDMPVAVAADEKIICAITVGNTAEQRSFKERLMYRITHRKTKTAEEMFTSDTPVPDWFMQGMLCVQKAPSAINRQPVMFSYAGGKVSASVKDISNTLSALDFGIAKLHFEIGAGGGTWEWGNGGAFTQALDE